MKDIKITNYTTKDWLKGMGSIFCFIFLGNQAVRSFIEGDWLHGLMFSLGALGWMLIYLRVNKEIRKKNPQEGDVHYKEM